MTNWKRIIKYLAIAFAIFLTVTIIGSILSIIYSIVGEFSYTKEYDLKETDHFIINENIQELSIDIATANLSIKTSDRIELKTNNKYIKVKENNNGISIIEKDHNLFNSKSSYLIVYIPKNYNFNEVEIDTGAGKIEIDELNANKLSLTLGAGQAELKNVNIKNEADIETGVGKTTILNSYFKNLDLDAGVGKVSMTAKVIGSSSIDAGVGEIDINLDGGLNDYKIKVEKGIGSFKINKEAVKDGTYYGNGNNLIDISGGIGSLNVNFYTDSSIAETFSKTFHVINKTVKNDQFEYYLTLKDNLGEVDTVVVMDKENIIQENNDYIFTFKNTSTKKNTIEEIFKSDLVKIEKTSLSDN